MEWSMVDKVTNHRYAYKYDGLSRLVSADYYRNGKKTGDYSTSYAYDLMGNVLSLTRKGLLDDRSYGLVDNLSYEYHGNQVTKVTDAVSGPYYKNAMHFVDGADDKVEYEYNKNGAMIKDLNKGIELIEYNQLNLPNKVLFSDGSIISNSYDADGNKLRTSYHVKLASAVSSSSSGSSVAKYIDYRRDYCGDVEYRDDELSCWRYDGGHLEFAENDSAVYLYDLKDNQGNVRVSATGDEDNVITDANHYYPFGSLMGCSQVGTYAYRYNDKLLELTHGLNCYDYGARAYDGMRFTTSDPHAETYTPFSPYAYCLDNPIRLIDKDGNDPGDFFLTMDEAAMDFGLFYNAASIRENREYGSSIYEVWDKEKGKGYSYSIANVGKGNSSVFISKPNKYYHVVADIHTHGAYDEDYFNDDFSGCHDEKNKVLSPSKLKKVDNNYDIGLSNKCKRSWYVVTPSGSLQKYNPMTGIISIISNRMPSDFNDPDRVNSKAVIYVKPIQNNFNIKSFLYK